STSERTSAEWVGIWQFQNGYYTHVMMKRRRDKFWNYKRNLYDLGFESSAGPYESDEKRVVLSQSLTFIPLNVGRGIYLTYRIDGDTLTLIENLQPYIEDMREGTITTVLHRIK